MKIILMGPPGSGKGTQASYIASFAGVNSVSSGDLFRDNLARDTEAGTQEGQAIIEPSPLCQWCGAVIGPNQSMVDCEVCDSGQYHLAHLRRHKSAVHQQPGNQGKKIVLVTKSEVAATRTTRSLI